MNLLVTGAWTGAAEHIPQLEAAGHSVIFLQQESDPLPCGCDWVEGTVCNGLFLHHPIRSFENLKYIQLTSAGFDRVDMDYIQAHGIRINNARGVYSAPMAEFAVCGVLQLYKQSRFFHKNQSRRVWEKHRGLLELSGKSVVIAGCGSVGTHCARLFKAFGCRVCGMDLYPREDESFDEMQPLEKLDGLISGADVLVLTLPLTDDTRRIIDSRRLALMKSSAVVVNISRGAVIDEGALAGALEEGRLAGAVLDVFETEPLDENSPLWAMENVILTPHNSFVGDGNKERLYRLIMENIKYFYKEVQ